MPSPIIPVEKIESIFIKVQRCKTCVMESLILLVTAYTPEKTFTNRTCFLMRFMLWLKF